MQDLKNHKSANQLDCAVKHYQYCRKQGNGIIKSLKRAVKFIF